MNYFAIKSVEVHFKVVWMSVFAYSLTPSLSAHSTQVTGHLTSKFNPHVKVNGFLLQLKFGAILLCSFCIRMNTHIE